MKIMIVGMVFIIGVLTYVYLDSNTAPKREATKKEVKDCIAVINKQYPFKDIDSVKIEEQPQYIYSASDQTHTIMLQVNAKNSYGAYSGSRMMICLYKKDGSSIPIISRNN